MNTKQIVQLEKRLKALNNQRDQQRKIGDQLREEFNSKVNRYEQSGSKTVDVALEVVGLYEAELEELRKENEELKALLAQQELREEPAPEDPKLAKACTIAIFDSLLFAIENWSDDGDTAPDFSLACQAVLFPLVYDQVMKGNDHYYLKTVPVAAMEVVKRGREYVKFIRSTCPVGLTDPEAWSIHVPMITKWWVNDALPLLYGARDSAWEQSSTLDLTAIMSWRDQPASRALEFPLVFDAMDLIDRYREEIRETTNLPDFTRDTLNTRLETN